MELAVVRRGCDVNDRDSDLLMWMKGDLEARRGRAIVGRRKGPKSHGVRC